jgi:hypothetical protein
MSQRQLKQTEFYNNWSIHSFTFFSDEHFLTAFWICIVQEIMWEDSHLN